jgi:hypothetical protein
MGNTLTQFVPKEGAGIVLVLFLSFLIGLEREEQKVASEQYRFGGVPTRWSPTRWSPLTLTPLPGKMPFHIEIAGVSQRT